MCAQDDHPPYPDASCDGVTSRVRAGGYGLEAIPCNAMTGLTAFVDYQGVTRHACRWHRAYVERRFGVQEPEPEWPVVGGFSYVPGPTDAELREETRSDRELMAAEFHGRDIDGSIRW